MSLRRDAMDRFGFIHDKLDIKILILFVLGRLPAAIDGNGLSQLVLIDDGISYFDYTDCLAELVETEHVEETDAGYRITEKGARNGGAIESSLPYSVRKKAERILAPVAEKLQRDNMIVTEILPGDGGAFRARLSLSDGVGEILSLQLLCGSEAQARAVCENFRADAERHYHRIIGMLS